jgi:hypothetical protein
MNGLRQSVECDAEVIVLARQNDWQFLAKFLWNMAAAQCDDGSVRSLLTVGEDRS